MVSDSLFNLNGNYWVTGQTSLGFITGHVSDKQVWSPVLAQGPQYNGKVTIFSGWIEEGRIIWRLYDGRTETNTHTHTMCKEAQLKYLLIPGLTMHPKLASNC